jgi:hypothetical protein
MTDNALQMCLCYPLSRIERTNGRTLLTCSEVGGPERGRDKRRDRVVTSEKGRMVDALATRADEGRGNAAKSHGEPLAGRSVDIRMGQPPSRDGEGPTLCGGQVGELKHLSTPKKRDNSRSSGERTGRSPNLTHVIPCRGCV